MVSVTGQGKKCVRRIEPADQHAGFRVAGTNAGLLGGLLKRAGEPLRRTRQVPDLHRAELTEAARMGVVESTQQCRFDFRCYRVRSARRGACDQ